MQRRLQANLIAAIRKERRIELFAKFKVRLFHLNNYKLNPSVSHLS